MAALKFERDFSHNISNVRTRTLRGLPSEASGDRIRRYKRRKEVSDADG